MIYKNRIIENWNRYEEIKQKGCKIHEVMFEKTWD